VNDHGFAHVYAISGAVLPGFLSTRVPGNSLLLLVHCALLDFTNQLPDAMEIALSGVKNAGRATLVR
jgi:hypothetical protein